MVPSVVTVPLCLGDAGDHGCALEGIVGQDIDGPGVSSLVVSGIVGDVDATGVDGDIDGGGLGHAAAGDGVGKRIRSVVVGVRGIGDVVPSVVTVPLVPSVTPVTTGVPSKYRWPGH